VAMEAVSCGSSARVEMAHRGAGPGGGSCKDSDPVKMTSASARPDESPLMSPRGG
jgi:hypothetical protein